ncbi:Catabolite control protein A [Roseovarius tolerans]|uniref:Catabolite control protein A n=1 Tax=Roseovarius tolerans TaxID=74031 RepID=A0A0L6CTE0_9RHOB|nr:LacI family DNA-binding transcriptional regulator [Roseovarius tolerans]KNX41037.1 Catabolite control protein A [Roseovarius tolerans]
MAPISAPRPAPTLEDVARAAEVSTATVSRCLNTPGKVSDDTRLRVMAAVAALGYAPNFGARAMVSRRTRTIGAVIPTMENAIFARGLQAFQEELRTLGYQLLVASSSYRQDVEEEQIRSLVARGADGLLLIGHDRAPQVTEFLQQRGLPVLVTWAYDPAQTGVSVGFDNRRAMRTLAEKTLDLGHRDIAVITAPLADNDRARARVDGIRDAIAARGLSIEGLRLIETDYGITTGGDAFAALMQTSPRPTVVMCGNDVLAVGAVKRARALGLSVPGDVSITGFDDIDIASVVEPALTTVHVPHRAMGAAAARCLIRMIEENGAVAPQELDAHVTWRDSLGRPPR